MKWGQGLQRGWVLSFFVMTPLTHMASSLASLRTDPVSETHLSDFCSESIHCTVRAWDSKGPDRDLIQVFFKVESPDSASDSLSPSYYFSYRHRVYRIWMENLEVHLIRTRSRLESGAPMIKPLSVTELLKLRHERGCGEEVEVKSKDLSVNGLQLSCF